MTTIDPNVVDTHLAQGLRERAADLGDEDRFYEQVLATIAVLPQRRSYRRWPARFGRRTSLVLVAAALTGIITGTALVGGLLGPHPDPSMVPPSEAPSTAPSLDAKPTAVTEAGRIVYTRRVRLAFGEGGCTTASSPVSCHRSSVVISDADGSNEQELVPGPSAVLQAATVDGSKLLVWILEDDRSGLFLTDASGSAPQRLDIPCPAPCSVDVNFAFSPDGTRLAFVRAFADETSVIAILDLATGAVDELESTLGYASPPGWSPDGSRLAFANHIVDADGSNFERIAPDNLFTGLSGAYTGTQAPSQWSHDGSLIAFTSSREAIAPPDHGQRFMDIYAVRPDGTGLQRLTTDTVPPLGNNVGDFGATFPTWTSHGRIVFTRHPFPPVFAELWVMDSDGSNAVQLDPSDAAALTALGCVVCTYPALTDYAKISSLAYWIPSR